MSESRKAQLAAAEEVRARVASQLVNTESPLEYMLRVMRDATADDKRRDSMALGAAQYLHPKLAAVEHSGDANNPVAYAILTGVPEPDEPATTSANDDSISATSH